MSYCQTLYSSSLKPGLEGQIAQAEQVTNIISGHLKSKKPISPGTALRYGKDQATILEAAQHQGRFLGIAARDSSALSPQGVYMPDTLVPIATKGVLFVKTSTAVSAGDKVYLTSEGQYSNEETNNEALDNAVFASSGGAGSLVLLRLS